MSPKPKPPNKRDNQITFYLSRDGVMQAYEAFKRAYPYAGDTAIINAALRFYLERAKDGVDGNLQPYVRPT